MNKNMDKNKVKKLFECYYPEFRPPEWILESDNVTKEHMNLVKVYRDEGAEDCKDLVKFREPTNLGSDKLYHRNKLKKHFGYEIGVYNEKSSNVAIYCKTPVKVGEKKWRDIHVINVIAPALDSEEQPDYQRLVKIKDVGMRRREYKRMFMSCFTKIGQCLGDGDFESVILHGFGLGCFDVYSGKLGLNSVEVFKECYRETLRSWDGKIFTNRMAFFGNDDGNVQMHNNIVDIMKKCKLDKTLIVNAWDCFSMVGNGNGGDNSLDGFMGRVSAMSVLCWPFTNPLMKFR